MQSVQCVVEVDNPEEANTYMELGWTLLGVHQHMRMQVGMIRAGTAYVLGHTKPHPPRPGEEEIDIDAILPE